MKLKYDYWDRTRPCDIYLARSGKRILGSLNGVQRADLTPRLCEPSTLELEVARIEDGEVSNFYDEIDSFMELYIPEFGWFYIEEPPRIQKEASQEIKSFTAMSYEYTLKNDDLIGFKINCGTEGSLEMYEENTDVDGIPKEQIVLYNPDKPSLSLIHLVLSNVSRTWKPGHIDTSLRSLRRSFEEDSVDVLSFFQKMSKAFRCIFQFDSEHMEVNAYDLSTYGQNTNICLTYDTILNNCSIQSDSDEIYTVFTVEGEDDLLINPVNLGSSDIVNINYFLHRQFPQSVIDKYDAYLAARSSLAAQYLVPYKKYADALERQSEILNRVPEDAVTNNWAAYDLPQLYTELDIYKKLIAKIEERNKKPDGTLDMSNSPDLGMYLSFKNVVIPDIQAEITRKESGSVEEAPKTDYEIMWDLYGVNELEAKISNYEQLIASYQQNGYDKPWPGGTGTGTEALWKSRQQSYKKYKDYLKQAQAALKNRQAQADSWKSVMDASEREMDTLSKKGHPDHPDYGFSKEELAAIKALYRHTDYTDSNIILSDFDGVNGRLEKQKELLQSAQDQLEIESQPQLQFSISTDNPFYMEEFSHLREEMDIGNFIYVETAPDYYEKARISEMTFSILEWDKDLDIKFSTVTTSYGKKSDFLNLVDKLSSSGKNTIKAAASTATDSAIQKFLRTVFDRYSGENALNSQISSINSDTLRQFANIETNYLKTEELAAEIAKVGKLEADSAFIKYLTAQFLTADSAVFQDLSAEIAKFKDMVAGNILVEDGYVFNFTAKNAHLDEAFIREFVASKITALVLTSAKITSNDLLIQSDEGDAGMKLAGNTLQFYNSLGKVGIQIGYDAAGHPSLLICDSTGNIMLDASGLHDSIVPKDFIKSDMVGDGEIKQRNIDTTGIREWLDEDGNTIFDVSKMKFNDQEFSVMYETQKQEIEHLSYMTDSITIVGGQVFTEADNIITPSSITVHAIARNNAVISRWLLDGIETSSGISEDKSSITIPSSAVTNKQSLHIRCENQDKTLYDEHTIYCVRQGKPGESPVLVFLSRDSHSFLAAANGLAVPTSIIVSISCYKGTKAVACTVGKIGNIPPGMTVTVKNNDSMTSYLQIDVIPSLTGSSGVLTIPVRPSDSSDSTSEYIKEFSWCKLADAAELEGELITLKNTVSGVSTKVDEVQNSIDNSVWLNTTIDYYDENGNPVKHELKNLGSLIHQDFEKISQTVSETDSKIGNPGDPTSGTSVYSHISSIEQTAKRIDLVVKSNTGASNLALTDQMIAVATRDLKISALTTFMNASQSGSSTVIDGGAIKTGSIDANRIKANSITADRIKTNAITAAQITTGNIAGTNGWINLHSGTFNYGSGKLSWNGSTLSINGTVTATAGKIAGFNINSTYIAQNTTSLGGTNNSVYLGNNGISCGTAFKVTNAGVLTATNATISGNITASSGKIATWTIDGDHIYNGIAYTGAKNNNSTGMGAYGKGLAFWAGNGRFSVTQTGSLYASNASITGAIDATSINVKENLCMYSNRTAKNSSMLKLISSSVYDTLQIGGDLVSGATVEIKRGVSTSSLSSSGVYCNEISTASLETGVITLNNENGCYINSFYNNIILNPSTNGTYYGSIMVDSAGYLRPTQVAGDNAGFSYGSASFRIHKVWTLKGVDTSSVYDLKTNIEKLKSAREEIMKTDVCSYNLKCDLKDGIYQKNYGFIIGGGYSISEKFISESGEGVLGYNIDAFLCKGIQELYCETDSLELKYQELLAAAESLKAQIADLKQNRCIN